MKENQPINVIGISPIKCETIPHANLAGYFKRLVGLGVDQRDALKLVFNCKQRIEDPKLSVIKRINTAEAVNTAAAVLPKKLRPIYETVSRK